MSCKHISNLIGKIFYTSYLKFVDAVTAGNDYGYRIMLFDIVLFGLLFVPALDSLNFSIALIALLL